MTLTEHLKVGGQFTFPANSLSKRTLSYKIRFGRKGIKLREYQALPASYTITEQIKETRPYVPDIITNILQQNNSDQYTDILKFKSIEDIAKEAPGYQEEDTSDTNFSYIGMSLQELIEQENLPIKITSGYRHNSRTKSGNASFHSKLDEYGNPQAYDIQPYFNGEIDKSVEGFQVIEDILMSNPKVRKWFEDNGYGILDESYEAAMKKTGATGPHFHIGKDQIAIKGFSRLKRKYTLNDEKV